MNHLHHNQDFSHHIDRLKESFLCAAAKGGRLQEVASLLDFGAETEWNDISNENTSDTPLVAAVRSGHKDVVALLLAHGADPTRRDQNGNTVLHLVAASGDEGMVNLFAPSASELSNITNNDGMTAVDIAVQRGYTLFAELLYNLCDDTNLDTVDNNARRNTRTRVDTRRSSSQETNSLASSNAGGYDCNDDSLSCFSSTNSDEHDLVSRSGCHDAEEGCIGAIHVGYSNDSADEGESNEDDDNDNESSINEEQEVHFPNPSLINTSFPCFDVGNDEDEPDTVDKSSDPESIMKQLRYMTQLAHSQSVELYQAKYALNETMQERDRLKEELDEMQMLLSADESKLAHKSLSELQSLEDQVKKSLERIVKVKEAASLNIEVERICVICRENPKNVLLLGCRHLCVCSECGQRDDLDRCPLCREIIVERINVYS